MTGGDNWQHQIRVETILTPLSNCFYPVCISGQRACPPEDCGGPWEFMAQKQEYSVRYIAFRCSTLWMKVISLAILKRCTNYANG